MTGNVQANNLGLVQVYTGDGKGKTTAALGLALRAAGRGYYSFIGQFMKGQDYGELHSVPRLAPYVTLEQFGLPTFVQLNNPSAQDRAAAERGLLRIREVLASGKYQIVIMDEICVALYFKLLPVTDVIEIIEGRPPGVELVLTGRGAPQEILARADLITEMVAVRHPFEHGLGARRGIED